jgi:hypothetical protein
MQRMGIDWDEYALARDVPTNASYTSEAYDRTNFPNGAISALLDPSDGANLEATLKLVGSDFPATTAHPISAWPELPLIVDQYFVNGIKSSSVSVTGLTMPTATNPASFVVAADMHTALEIWVPMTNMPRYIAAVYTRSSGGGAAEYLQAVIQATRG